MNHLPAEIIQTIVDLANPLASLALSQTCRRLQTMCASKIWLPYAYIDMGSAISRRYSKVICRRFAGVHSLTICFAFVALGKMVLPNPRGKLKIVSGSLASKTCTKLCPSQLAMLTQNTKHVEVWGCDLVADETSNDEKMRQTLSHCTKLVLRCPCTCTTFDWPLQEWIGPTLKSLTVTTWKATETQWMTLISQLEGLETFSVKFSHTFAHGQCATLFDTCKTLKEAQIFDCADDLMFADVLRAAKNATRLRCLEYARSVSEIDETGGVTQDCVKAGLPVLQRLHLLGIDDIPIEDDAIYFIYENCRKLEECHTDRAFCVHRAANVRRLKLHPEWPPIKDLWNFDSYC